MYASASRVLRRGLAAWGAGALLLASLVGDPASASRLAQAGPTSAAGTAQGSAALPFSVTQHAGGYVIENLRFSLGAIAYTVPRADVRGSRLSREELATLLDPGSAVPLAERMNRLSATEIVIPEVRAELDDKSGRQVTTYRDVRLADFADGRIARATGGGGSFTTATPEGRSDGGFARMELTEIDAGLIVSLFEKPVPGQPNDLRKVYGSFSLEGLTSKDAKGGGARIARMAGRDLWARPTPDGWVETMNRLSGNIDLNKAPPEQRSRVVRALVDLLESFEIGALEATGIEFSDAGSDNSAGRIARIAYASGKDGSELRLDGLEASGDGGRFKLASFSVAGVSLKPMLGAARELSGKVGELKPEEVRRLVPIIGSVRLSGIELQGKPEKSRAADPPLRVSVGSVELAGDKVVENIPSELRVGLRNIVFPIVPGATDDASKQLEGLGYDKVDASLTAALGWNEGRRELVLSELSVQSAGMGAIVLRAVLGNVSRDLFDPDPALASIALVGATAQSLEIEVDNRGLFERILAREARRQRRTVDDLRREYGTGAALGIPLMLGNSQAAKTLGQAVARFAAKPGRLTIQLRARDPGGLGAADFLGSPDPTSLLEKVDLTAKAE